MVEDMKKLSERIIEVLERNEFNIGEVTKQDNEFAFLYFRYFSIYICIK